MYEEEKDELDEKFRLANEWSAEQRERHMKSELIRVTVGPSKPDPRDRLRYEQRVAEEIERKALAKQNNIRLNLTQHVATQDQLKNGVMEPSPETKKRIQSLLTFEAPPENGEEIAARAVMLAQICKEAGVKSAMIGGAPYLMVPLQKALEQEGIAPVFAFSEQRMVEGPDGHKTQTFSHVGFVSPNEVSAIESVFLKTRRSEQTLNQSLKVEVEPFDISNPGKIFNLTQFSASPEQKSAGVIEPESKELIKAMLTFTEQDLPRINATMKNRAETLAGIVARSGARAAMIGGASFYLESLEDALRYRSIVPLYSYSERVSREELNKETGELKKDSYFKHVEFIEAVSNSKDLVQKAAKLRDKLSSEKNIEADKTVVKKLETVSQER